MTANVREAGAEDLSLHRGAVGRSKLDGIPVTSEAHERLPRRCRHPEPAGDVVACAHHGWDLQVCAHRQVDDQITDHGVPITRIVCEGLDQERTRSVTRPHGDLGAALDLDETDEENRRELSTRRRRCHVHRAPHLHCGPHVLRAPHLEEFRDHFSIELSHPPRGRLCRDGVGAGGLVHPHVEEDILHVTQWHPV